MAIILEAPQICYSTITMDILTEVQKVAQSSTCERSRCGAIIIKNDRIIGRGWNSPPGNLESQRRCQRKHELKPGFKSDRTCCIHAEQRAIADALHHFPADLPGAEMYFYRLGADKNLEITRPYCTVCSKAILDAGVARIALYRADGWQWYDTEAYNDISFNYSE